MPEKYDCDTPPGVRLLRIFRKLALNDRKYYQSELAEEFMCSSQTIIRVMADIETVIGANLQTGLDNRRRWYRIVSEAGLSKSLATPHIGAFSGICGAGAPFRMVKASFQAPGLIRNFSLGKKRDRNIKDNMLEVLENAVLENEALMLLYGEKAEESKFHFAPSKLLNIGGVYYIPGAILDSQLKPSGLAILEMDKIQKIYSQKSAPYIDYEAITHEPCALPWRKEPENLAAMFS